MKLYRSSFKTRQKAFIRVPRVAFFVNFLQFLNIGSFRAFIDVAHSHEISDNVFFSAANTKSRRDDGCCGIYISHLSGRSSSFFNGSGDFSRRSEDITLCWLRANTIRWVFSRQVKLPIPVVCCYVIFPSRVASVVSLDCNFFPIKLHFSRSDSFSVGFTIGTRGVEDQKKKYRGDVHHGTTFSSKHAKWPIINLFNGVLKINPSNH